jgi:hypothetical protein
MALHVFFGFPETAGKTLEETEAMFEDPHGIKYIGTPAWKTKKATSRVIELENGRIDKAALGGLAAEGTHVEDTVEKEAVATTVA